jgi:exosortase
MVRLDSPALHRLVVPLVSAVAFLGLLALVIPYSSSLWDVKRSLGHLIYSMSQFGTGTPEFAGYDYTYCLFVPIIFGYLVYHNAALLARTPIQGSNTGMAVIFAGILVYWFGMRAENQYFGYASIQILLAGVILWLWGWRIFRVLLFPWAFFIFAWPVPFLDPIVAFPLRMTMSKMASEILPMIGIPTVQSGTALLSGPDILHNVSTGSLFQIDIADPCSGIRSLFALLMFSALFGYLFLPKLWQQWLIFLSAVPLAIVGNLARVLLLVIGSLWFGTSFAVGTTEHPSWFHEGCGFAIYAVALGLEFILGALLTRSWNLTIEPRDEARVEA